MKKLLAALVSSLFAISVFAADAAPAAPATPATVKADTSVVRASATKKLIVNKEIPGYWKVTLSNPPINLIDDSMFDDLYDLVGEIEADPELKVVTFESANPDFFIAHYSSAKPRSRFGIPPWIETAKRLAASRVLSIAVIRGRVRGGGSEFAMALDLRFASRERAVFGQPEVGTGLIPGGGALQRLPLLVGRARALEIVLGAQDYDADTAERYGWINRAIPEAQLDAQVAEFVKRVLSFDKRVLAVSKAAINTAGLPVEAELQQTQDTFFQTFGWDGFKQRIPKLMQRGIGKAGEFELNLGKHIGELE
ncbi:enoyl-CoA hydratase/isomerase family protein [Variovorax sp. LjRoot178]|uniref:enoyl-CoA hydratase/isomerase family protein n=1 Tax=Variovorax sp. LjRoot178 TaxID=3342277 RepID=UPI003ECFB097